MPKVQLFVDESGFAQPKHEPRAGVFALVAYVGARTDFAQRAEAAFADERLDWRSFHATSRDPSACVAHARELVERLRDVTDVLIVTTKLERRRDDPYWAALVRAIAVAAEPHAGAPDALCFEVVVERRTPVNTRALAELAQTEIRERSTKTDVTVELQQANKGDHAGLALSDLFANVAWRRGLGAPVDLSDVHPAIRCRAIGGEDLPGTFVRSVNGCLDGGAPAVVVRTVMKERIVEHVVEQTKLVRDRRTTAQLCMELSDEAFERTPGAPAERWQRLAHTAAHDALRREGAEGFAAAVRELLDDAEKRIDSPSGPWLAARAWFVLEALRARGAERSRELRFAWIRAASLWLCARNHAGAFAAEDPEVQQALEWSPDFGAELGCAHTLALLHNCAGVAHQNVFDFGRAEQRMRPVVGWIDAQGPSPFGSAPADWWIGAMYGTWAQNHWFLAGVTASSLARAAYDELHEEGMLYSTAAEDRFREPGDRARHPTYRAHALLQRAMLWGDGADIAAALELLGGRETCGARLRALLGGEALPPNELFAAAAALKADWLLRWELCAQLDVDRALKAIDGFGAFHPYEQVLGYLALRPEERARRRAQQALVDTAWPPGIVAAIATVFRLQQAWETQGSVSSSGLDELRAALGPRLEPRWRELGLLQELPRCDRYPRRARGPVSLLPFNYC